MPLFNFTLDSFDVTTPRSENADTDFAAFTLKLGSEAPITFLKPLGNIGSGTHQVTLSFLGEDLGQDDVFLLSYLIVNAGSVSYAQIKPALISVCAAWANGEGPAPPPLASALGVDTTWFTQQLNGFLGSKCDGIVAAEQNRIPYGDLVASLTNGAAVHQTSHPGTHSPGGCGANSLYQVNWHIAYAAQLPSVIGLASDTPGANPAAKKAVDVLSHLGFSAQFENGKTGPYVVQQNPQPGLVDAGIQVTLWRGTQLQ